ncbi:MAG: (d)CMP kinase [Spirochaetales bacterium]|jgi:cytidylate kinase|nr:(d)CMP kinase [Spirochaetales bacterium]
MIIAIDGPAGVGKSTVARKIAEELDMFYLNSGNFYRAITYAHLPNLKNGVNSIDSVSLTATAAAADITLIQGRIHLSEMDVEDLLHSDAVDAWVAQVSAVVPVRHIVNDIVRLVTQGLDAVIEGRDIGTVVFPDAELKVYMDADVDVRAKRRFQQGTSGKSLEELKANITMRDKIDKNKDEGSLVQTADAFYLDTSHLTIEQVCDKVVRKIRESRTQ